MRESSQSEESLTEETAKKKGIYSGREAAGKCRQGEINLKAPLARKANISPTQPLVKATCSTEAANTGK